MVEPGGTNPSLVFAPTDLSILARCTIVYVTTLEGETEWSTNDRKGAREDGGGSCTEARDSRRINRHD